MNNLIILILSVLISLCQACDMSDERKVISFPTIVVEQPRDSLQIGEVFEAKVYLSDSSYLHIVNQDGSKGRKVFPVFKLNGKEVRNRSDYLIIKDTVDSNIVYEEYPLYREIECSLIFPHPIYAEGSVELQKLITYMVEK